MSYNTTDHTPRGSRDGAPASPDKPPASRRGWRYIGTVLASSIVLAALMLLLANLAFAQSTQKKAPPAPKPYLVEDIYPGAHPNSSEPNNLFSFKGTLLFSANHPDFGEELWRSEGTEKNTKLVEDIDPGPLVINDVEGVPTETGSSEPDKWLRTKKWIYFAATTVKYGEELWKSNGTAAGTSVVKDIVPGRPDSGAENFVSTGSNTTFFRAWDPNHGEELWKTDGTERGTKLVEDINPDSPPGARCPQNQCGIPKGWSHPDTLAAMGKTVFFAADDGKHGVELWKSDGTEKGTKLVKDINTVSGNSNPNDNVNNGDTQSAEVEKLFVVGKTLYFRATDGTATDGTDKHGVELWKSDGTEKGTKLVKDINPSAPAATTTSCKRTKSCVGSSWADDMTLVNGKVYFTANDGADKHGVELWRTDGTEAGTTLVKDVDPLDKARASDIANLVVIGKTLYFSANDGTNGLELWKSNGTEAGTTLVKDINPGAADSDPDQLTVLNGVLLFRADDGVHGFEMWGSDGTEAGTQLLLDIEPGAMGTEPGELTTSGPLLFFSASNPSAGEELWAVSTKGLTR
jgi:ELWxxDGT repeat protein